MFARSFTLAAIVRRRPAPRPVASSIGMTVSALTSTTHGIRGLTAEALYDAASIDAAASGAQSSQAQSNFGCQRVVTAFETAVVAAAAGAPATTGTVSQLVPSALAVPGGSPSPSPSSILRADLPAATIAAAPVYSLFPSPMDARDGIALLLRAYGALGRADWGRALFHATLRTTPPRHLSAALYDTWLQVLVQQPQVSLAEVAATLQSMDHHGIRRTAGTYLALVECHLRLQKDPSPLWHEMLTAGIAPTAAVAALFVKGVLPQRLQVVEDSDPGLYVSVLRHYLRLAPAADVGPLFLAGHFAHLARSAEAPPESALWLLYELELRCVADGVPLRDSLDRTASLVHLLLRCARCGDARTADAVAKVMERHLIPKNVDVLALLMWAQAVGGAVEAALDTLEDMARRGYLDHVDHTARYVVEAIAAPMEKHYLSAVADTLATKEAIDRAHSHLRRRYAEGAGVAVSVHALDVLVLAAARVGDEGRAEAIVASYPALGVAPRVQTFNALLLACGGRNSRARQRAVVDQMATVGVTPNHHTYRLLIRHAVIGHDVDAAVAFLREVAAKSNRVGSEGGSGTHGTQPTPRVDGEMVLPILERASAVGDSDTATAVVDIARECRVGIEAAVLRACVDRPRALGIEPVQLIQAIAKYEASKVHAR